MSIKPVVAIFIHLVISLGFSAVYLSSIKGFDDLASEKKGLNSATSADLWQKAANLFSSRKEEIKDTGLHNLFEKFSNISPDSNQLKETCIIGYGFTYKNLFFEDRTLFKNLNTFCRLKIREIFSSTDLIQKNVSEEADFLNRAKNLLNSHSDEHHGNVTSGSDGNSYAEGCDKGYESVYGGESTRSGKLANRYCNKTELNKNVNS